MKKLMMNHNLEQQRKVMMFVQEELTVVSFECTFPDDVLESLVEDGEMGRDDDEGEQIVDLVTCFLQHDTFG